MVAPVDFCEPVSVTICNVMVTVYRRLVSIQVTGTEIDDDFFSDSTSVALIKFSSKCGTRFYYPSNFVINKVAQLIQTGEFQTV